MAPTKDGGEALFGDTQVTDVGAESLNGGLYKYDSVEIGPVTDNATGKVTGNVFRSATLTNTPVLRMLPPVLDAGEHIAASEVCVALSEIEAAEDPVAALIAKIDALLADDTLKGKTGITAIRTMLREIKTHASAHAMSEDEPTSPSLSEPSPEGGATGDKIANGASDAGVGGQSPTGKEKKRMSDLTQLLKLSEDADDAVILAEVTKVHNRNAELEVRFAEGEKAERVRLLDEAIAGGHVLPAEKDSFVKLAESAPEIFSEQITARKGVQLVDLSERGDGKPAEEKAPPEDVTAELDEAAKKIVADRKVDYGEALTIALAEDEDLAARYNDRQK